jgi:hypothetical protein
METLMYEFIWDGKRDNIKRKTMIGEYKQGGLQMIDIKSYFDTLRIKWVKLIVDGEAANWKAIPKLYMNKFGNDYLLFKVNLDKI